MKKTFDAGTAPLVPSGSLVCGDRVVLVRLHGLEDSGVTHHVSKRNLASCAHLLHVAFRRRREPSSRAFPVSTWTCEGFTFWLM